MPFYHDYSDENAVILYWKYSDDDEFNAEELIEPENLEKAKIIIPKVIRTFDGKKKMLKMLLPEHKILYKTIGEPYLWARFCTYFYHAFFSICFFSGF